MGFWSRVKSYFSRSKPSSSSSTSTSSSSPSPSPSSSPAPSSGGSSGGSSSSSGGGSSAPQMSSGSSTIPQKELAPVRSTDYVDSSGKGAGATTLSGTNVWKSSGGGGSSSSGTRVLSSTFDAKTTQSLTGTSPDTQTKVLAPNDPRTTAKQLKPKSQTQTGWLSPNVYVPPTETGLPAGASYIAPMPYYQDPIQKDKQSLASKYDITLGQSIKEGWIGTDGYQITDTFNVLGGIQGGVSYFSDTYGGSKAITIPDTRYPRGSSGVYDPKTGEFNQPKTDTFTTLRTDALLNPDVYQPEGQASERKKNEVIAELTPKYKNLASGATSQAEIDKLNKQFETEAQTLYSTKIKGLDVRRQAGAQRVYEANVIAPSGLITTGGLIGASLIGGIPAVTASYLVSGQGLKTGFEGAREGDILKTGIGALQFGLGGYYGTKGTANLVTQSRIKALQNVKPSYTYGTRSIKGDIATDKGYYFRQTQYGTSQTNTLSITKVGSKGQFGGVGMRSDIINVKDAWSGKNIVIQNANFYGSTGQLLKTSQGWTPSIYQTKSTGYQATYFKDTLKIDTTPVKTTYGAGRTYNIDSKYVFSQSGGNVKITSKDLQFSGTNYFKDVSGTTKLGFSKDAVSILKLNKISSSSGTSGGSIISTSSGGGTITNINQVLGSSQASQLPKIAQVARTAPSVSKVVGGVSVGAIGGASLLSNVKASTIQLPKVDTTPAIKGGQQLKTIPATKTIVGTSATQIPSSSLQQIPAVTQLPAQNIIQAQKITPFTGQLSGQGTGGFSLPSFGGGLVVPFKFPSLGADIGQLGKRRIQARKVTAYTPSFNALFYNIKGSKPKGIETGLRIRPVTKGFNFGTIFKKARKVKI